MAETQLPPFPMPLDKWNAIVEQMDFSPRQQQMVELILRNQASGKLKRHWTCGMEHSASN